MILNIIYLLAGFVILMKGADWFIDGASGVAGNFKVSKILIGLTIVAFGTGAPELAISIKSSLAGNSDIVLGNVIGSNIINILLILGISASFHSLTVKYNTVKKELPITLLITTAFAVLISDSFFTKGVENSFTRSDGIILVLFFLVFLYYIFGIAKNKIDEDSEEKYPPFKKSIFLTILGLAGIVFGGNAVVDGAVGVAKIMGISERMISMTIIAIGTSLPELVTSVTATRKGEYDLAIGNIVGSNIFNIGIVLGLPVALFGGVAQVNFSYVDILVMLAAALSLYLYCFRDYKLSRFEGFLFLLTFFVYYGYIIFGQV